MDNPARAITATNEDSISRFIQLPGAMIRRQKGLRLGVLMVDEATLVFSSIPALVEAGRSIGSGCRSKRRLLGHNPHCEIASAARNASTSTSVAVCGQPL
jgi:hypothetical protein